ncbi:MAG: hypothetical protein ACREPB_10045 [Arenimonas sp.]
MNLLSQLAWSLPTLLVCIVGIIMMQTRALPRKTKTLGSAGLALVVLGAMGGIAFNVYLSAGGMDYSSAGFRFMQTGYSAIMLVLRVASLALLVMAICNKEQVATPDNTVGNPYQ